MSTVIETLGKYESTLRSRNLKPATLRKVTLSMKYFCELYGNTETETLKATDMQTFYHRLKQRKSRKAKKGEEKSLGNDHLGKILRHVKAYLKRLSDNAKLGILVPADMPSCKGNGKRIAYLSKEEMSLLMCHLEKVVVETNASGKKKDIYDAYLRRAVIWMLYTSGLRNFELRELCHDNVNITELCAYIIGKGSKPAIITFSDTATEKLNEYLNVRKSLFPDINFNSVFTLYEKGSASRLTEQKLNIALKKNAVDAGIAQNVFAHIFRHTLATHLVQDGRNMVDIMSKMRHSSLAITSVYVHSNQEEVRAKTKSIGTNLLPMTNVSIVNEGFTVQVMHEIILRMLAFAN